MTRAALLLLLASLAASAAGDDHSAGDPFLFKKIINFAILAAGLGYLVVKSLVPALKTKQHSILDGLKQASRRAEAAAARAAEMDRKVAGLQDDIAALRAAAREEMRAEAARFERETAAQLAKIEHAAEVEIGSAVKAARQELKTYSAELAIGLARRKIAERLDGPAQDRLVTRFTTRLAAGKAEDN